MASWAPADEASLREDLEAERRRLADLEDRAAVVDETRRAEMLRALRVDVATLERMLGGAER